MTFGILEGCKTCFSEQAHKTTHSNQGQNGIKQHIANKLQQLGNTKDHASILNTVNQLMGNMSNGQSHLKTPPNSQRVSKIASQPTINQYNLKPIINNNASMAQSTPFQPYLSINALQTRGVQPRPQIIAFNNQNSTSAFNRSTPIQSISTNTSFSHLKSFSNNNTSQPRLVNTESNISTAAKPVMPSTIGTAPQLTNSSIQSTFANPKPAIPLNTEGNRGIKSQLTASPNNNITPQTSTLNNKPFNTMNATSNAFNIDTKPTMPKSLPHVANVGNNQTSFTMATQPNINNLSKPIPSLNTGTAPQLKGLEINTAISAQPTRPISTDFTPPFKGPDANQALAAMDNKPNVGHFAQPIKPISTDFTPPFKGLDANQTLAAMGNKPNVGHFAQPIKPVSTDFTPPFNGPDANQALAAMGNKPNVGHFAQPIKPISTDFTPPFKGPDANQTLATMGNKPNVGHFAQPIKPVSTDFTPPFKGLDANQALAAMGNKPNVGHFAQPIKPISTDFTPPFKGPDANQALAAMGNKPNVGHFAQPIKPISTDFTPPFTNTLSGNNTMVETAHDKPFGNTTPETVNPPSDLGLEGNQPVQMVTK